LVIADFQTLKEAKAHISKNKLSEKFNRRDVAIFNQYSKEHIDSLPDEQYPKDIGHDQIYGDIEHPNFAELAWDTDFIKNAFGKTITVKLARGEGALLKRSITENVEKASDVKNHTPLNQKKDSSVIDEEDPDINRIKCQMRTIIEDYNIKEEVVADYWCQTSGNMNEIRKLLQGKKNIVRWTYLEDLALTMPETSQEF
jgi:hypothetical protein